MLRPVASNLAPLVFSDPPCIVPASRALGLPASRALARAIGLAASRALDLPVSRALGLAGAPAAAAAAGAAAAAPARRTMLGAPAAAAAAQPRGRSSGACRSSHSRSSSRSGGTPHLECWARLPQQPQHNLAGARRAPAAADAAGAAAAAAARRTLNAGSACRSSRSTTSRALVGRLPSSHSRSRSRSGGTPHLECWARLPQQPQPTSRRRALVGDGRACRSRHSRGAAAPAARRTLNGGRACRSSRSTTSRAPVGRLPQQPSSREFFGRARRGG